MASRAVEAVCPSNRPAKEIDFDGHRRLELSKFFKFRSAANLVGAAYCQRDERGSPQETEIYAR